MTALNVLAPNGTEPPFLAVQGLLLVSAALLGWKATSAGAVRDPIAAR